MRVVDDLAGQEDVAIGEAAPRLVGVVDRAIHAVAEAELAGEVHRQAAGLVPEVVGADLFDDRAVVGRGQLAGDGLLHVEALAEDQGLRTVANRLPLPSVERHARRDRVERVQLRQRVTRQ